jgi:hypothetical protein
VCGCGGLRKACAVQNVDERGGLEGGAANNEFGVYKQDNKSKSNKMRLFVMANRHYRDQECRRLGGILI